MGPEQAAEAVEQHHAPQIGRTGQGLGQADAGQLALQQTRRIAERQALDRRAAAGLQPGLRLRPCRQQGRQAAEGVTHQHHPIALNRQAPLALDRQHRRHIPQPHRQGFGPRRWTLAIERSLEGLAITAGMLQHHHRPAALGQGTGQPAELIGITAQPGEHQQPGPAGGISRRRVRGGPDIQGQLLLAMIHRQGQVQRLGRLALAEGQGPALPAGQHQLLEIAQRQALAIELLTPLLGQGQQPIELEAETGQRQRLQQAQGRHLTLLAQQLLEGFLQQGGGGLALRGGEQIPEFGQHLAPRPAVEQLATEGAIPQQGSPQQPQQISAAVSFEQLQPDRHIGTGGAEAAGSQERRTLGMATPDLQLIEADRNLQAIQAQLQQLRRQRRTPLGQHGCCDQQTGQHGPDPWEAPRRAR